MRCLFAPPNCAAHAAVQAALAAAPVENVGHVTLYSEADPTSPRGESLLELPPAAAGLMDRDPDWPELTEELLGRAHRISRRRIELLVATAESNLYALPPNWYHLRNGAGPAYNTFATEAFGASAAVDGVAWDSYGSTAEDVAALRVQAWIAVVRAARKKGFTALAARLAATVATEVIAAARVAFRPDLRERLTEPWKIIRSVARQTTNRRIQQQESMPKVLPTGGGPEVGTTLRIEVTYDPNSFVAPRLAYQVANSLGVVLGVAEPTYIPPEKGNMMFTLEENLEWLRRQVTEGRIQVVLRDPVSREASDASLPGQGGLDAAETLQSAESSD
jgi:hypothetical protein